MGAGMNLVSVIHQKIKKTHPHTHTHTKLQGVPFFREHGCCN